MFGGANRYGRPMLGDDIPMAMGLTGRPVAVSVKLASQTTIQKKDILF